MMCPLYKILGYFKRQSLANLLHNLPFACKKALYVIWLYFMYTNVDSKQIVKFGYM